MTARLENHINPGDSKRELEGRELPAATDISSHVALVCKSMLKTWAADALLFRNRQ